MKSERAWVGITCGFFLFIVVCLLLLLHMKGVFRATGNPEVGLLYFLLPGAAASCLSPGRRVIQPLVGAILAGLIIWLLRRYLASRIGVFSFLTPLFGVAFGVLLLDEPLEPGFLAGAILVCTGILLVSGYGWIKMTRAKINGMP